VVRREQHAGKKTVHKKKSSGEGTQAKKCGPGEVWGGIIGKKIISRVWAVIGIVKLGGTKKPRKRYEPKYDIHRGIGNYE